MVLGGTVDLIAIIFFLPVLQAALTTSVTIDISQEPSLFIGVGTHIKIISQALDNA